MFNNVHLNHYTGVRLQFMKILRHTEQKLHLLSAQFQLNYLLNIEFHVGQCGILSMIEIPLHSRCIHILTKYIGITGDK